MRMGTRMVAVLATIAAASGSAAAGCGGDDGSGSEQIPQPPVRGLPVAADSERIDLDQPSFSNPTEVTNPLHPVPDSVLMLGHVEGKPFRTEVTRLPQTRLIEWDGARIEAIVSQYTAYLDSRIEEVAYDYYAQADDGSVWYLGEDVFDFADGAIASTEGTWLAGRDGPGAMIMPADPQPGDVYRTENVPGFVFEEVTVKQVDRAVRGPLGPVEGAIGVSELHMDKTRETKTFAPGYAEFFTGGQGDVEALALAVPTDVAEGSEPRELSSLQDQAKAIYTGSGSVEPGAVARIEAAWANYPRGQIPFRIRPVMVAAIEQLARATKEGDRAAARAAAFEVGQLSLDLALRYRPQAEVDRGRLALWASRLRLDAAAGDAAAVNGDVFTIDYIRDRITDSLDPAALQSVDTAVTELQAASLDGELEEAAATAADLRSAVEPTGS
jgi:hypothetical protein